MQQRPYTHFGDPAGMTYGVQLLLVLNIAAALIDWLIFPLKPLFELHANWWTHFGVWELVTYQFLHQGVRHILFNMLALFFIGPEVERGIGTHRFFILYFLSGILGGLGWSLLSPPWHSCVGASGAVFGVLGAFAALYPDRELYVWGILPVKAWLLVVILGAYELLNVLGGPGGVVANAAHLGGALAGVAYTIIISRPDIMRKIRSSLAPRKKPPVSRSEIDRILDKAAQHGMHSLTPAERATLKRAGRQ
ncbi:rhomboid family protein [Tichowtungia aerotolerans]|uniref:Rhomboid family intramembrane serine protease n=1 Tax=Tichowtungia aerotolerans TaxID=2697043 RepID=A0A6P1M993_9BACT|nr:rhomboid family intramembrane serine protease [Tichowtungia aerotolerans]QHI70602.1 rhomboid family intramembrane serine protease [Tichowtungia aerotolerans]